MQDRIRGALVGMAIGDALGFPVRDMTYREMVNLHSEYELYPEFGMMGYWGKAEVSALTKAALHTVERLINTGRSLLPETEADGETDASIAQIVPIPLYAAASGEMDVTQADAMALSMARKHYEDPQGFISAGVLAHVVYMLLTDERPTKESLIRYAMKGVNAMQQWLPECKEEVWQVKNLIKRAARFSKWHVSHCQIADCYGLDQLDSSRYISELGNWQTGSTPLAVALFSCLSYFDNFALTLVTAVNHDGDSGEAGAVAGSILGAAIGLKGMRAAKPRLVDELGHAEQIINTADRLCFGGSRYTKPIK